MKPDAHREFARTLKVLRDDTAAIFKVFKEDRSQPIVRALVRSYSSMAEAAVYGLRAATIELMNRGSIPFDQGERSILEEKSYFLDKKGLIQERDNFQRLLPMVLYSVRAYSKSQGIEYSLDTSSHKWESLNILFETRNRIMHPTDSSSLEITDEEHEKCIEGANWFVDSLLKMFEKIEEKNSAGSK